VINLDKSDGRNPVLIVTKGNETVKFPIDKNIAIVNGKTIEMPGLTVLQ
jgi:alkaline phosphatase